MPDPLSEVLSSIRLIGGVFLEASFTAPWSVAGQIGPDSCKPFVADLARVICYHVVMDGTMLVMLDGDPPVRLNAGEIVMFPRNDSHVMASEAGLPPVGVAELIMELPGGGPMSIRHGGGRERTDIVCGFLATEEVFSPLLDTLPRMLKLDIRKATSRTWIESSVRFAASELMGGRLASSSVVSRLSEVLLIEAVREYASTVNGTKQGWLRGISDPHIGHALALIHGKLAAPWSAESLAQAVALSRSTFMGRFTELVGVPPIRYLTRYRLASARQRLLDTRLSIAQVGSTVGYESEEGFRRAFKREFGIWPSEWRDRQAAA